jgi:hypothetical protein
MAILSTYFDFMEKYRETKRTKIIKTLPDNLDAFILVSKQHKMQRTQ